MFQHLAVLFMRNTNHTGTILSVPPPQATLVLNHHQIIMFTHHSTVSMNQDIYITGYHIKIVHQIYN